MLESLAARGVMTRGVLATTLARRPLASGPRHGHVLKLRQGRQPRRDGARDGVRVHLELPDATHHGHAAGRMRKRLCNR